MGFISDFHSNVDPMIESALSDTVTYIKPGHEPVSVTGYFENDYAEVLDVSGYSPYFSCRKTAIDNPARNDRIVFDGVTYTVTEVQPNKPDQGFISLMLKI